MRVERLGIKASEIEAAESMSGHAMGLRFQTSGVTIEGEAVRS